MRLALKSLQVITELMKFVIVVIELVSKVANYGREFLQFRVQLPQFQG